VPQIVVASIADLDRLEQSIATSAAATAQRLFAQLEKAKDLAALARLKFEEAGCDPLDTTRVLNFVEQLNQSFTYLATVGGARWLLSEHVSNAPFRLNLGTAPGPDIVSADNDVVAEVFAATRPDSNDKLRKDVAKVRAFPAKYRYVFYLSPLDAAEEYDDVRVIRLDHSCLAQFSGPDRSRSSAVPRQ